MQIIYSNNKIKTLTFQISIKMQIIIWYMKSILLETLSMNMQIVYNSSI